MKEKWFGDDRDLVKWSALLHVARRNGLTTILQVAYAASESLPSIQVGEEKCVVDVEVWSFFRDLQRIKRLGEVARMTIDIVDVPFDAGRRDDYRRDVVRAIRRHSDDGGLLVFLDPDTGLAPRSPNSQHVSHAELKSYWTCLKPGDWIALYQHRRHDKTWKTDVGEAMREILEGALVSVARSEEVGKDVALFFARKTWASRE